MRLPKFVVALSILCVASTAVLAAETDKACVAGKDGAKCAVACSGCQECPVGKAMAALPKLEYKIGDQKTTSPIEAGRMATKTKNKIQFMVGKKLFKEESVAFASLVDVTEKFVDDFAKPKKCETSGQTLVAGKSLCCDVAAGEVVTLVKKAMDGVNVTYQVGDESVCCPDAAKALAKKSGAKVVQLIAGKKCGGCGTTTRLAVAHAKYKAAIEALLAADKSSSKNSDPTAVKEVVEVSAS